MRKLIHSVAGLGGNIDYSLAEARTRQLEMIDELRGMPDAVSRELAEAMQPILQHVNDYDEPPAGSVTNFR